MPKFDDTKLRTDLGAVGATGSALLAKERALLTGGADVARTRIGDQDVNLQDAYRKSVKAGSFINLKGDPTARARAQATRELGLTAEVEDVAFDPTGKDIGGDLAELSAQYGVGQNVFIEARRAQATGPVVGETGAAGAGGLESFAERSALPAEGTPSPAESYWDASRGEQVYAKPGEHFNLFPGGGVRVVKGDLPEGAAGAPASSLFTQPTTGTGAEEQAVEGFKEEQLGITPAEGKEIARTGRTGFNPRTGADIPVGSDEIFIEYTDGTFEVRKHSGIQEAGETQRLEEGGKSIDELRADQGLPPLDQKGEVDNTGLEYIGKEYTSESGEKRTVKDEGNAFYQDPETRKILERPDTGQEGALQTTSPSILGARRDTEDMFLSVYGRKPDDTERRYWEGRTDKVGAALLGAMQFTKLQGDTIGEVTGDPQQQIDSLNEAANKRQLKNMQALEAGDPIETRGARVRPREVPEQTSAREDLRNELANSQLQEAMNDLNTAKDALRTLDTDFRNILVEQERTPGLSTAAIRRNQSELEITYNRQRAAVVDEVQAYNDILNGQMTMLQMVMEANATDRQTAQWKYTQEFNRATAMYNMIRQDERDEADARQRVVDNYRANLTVYSNAITSGNLDPSQLDSSARAVLRNMEMTVGLSSGFTEFLGQAVEDPVVTIGSNIVGADGTVVTPVYTVDPKTGAITTKHITQPVKERIPSTGSGGLSPSQEISINNRFFDDLQDFAEREAQVYDPKAGAVGGRERVANALIQKYGSMMSPESIEKDVYGQLTPGWEGRFKNVSSRKSSDDGPIY